MKVEKMLSAEVARVYRSHEQYVIYTTSIFTLAIMALLISWIFMFGSVFNFLYILFLLLIVAIVTRFYIKLMEVERDRYVRKLSEFYNKTKLQYFNYALKENATTENKKA